MAGSSASTTIKFVVCCMIMVGLMHLYHAWLGFDPLAYIGINGSLVSVDSWSLVHVIYFAGLGYLHPDQLLLFMLYGIAWEGIEFAIAQSPIVRSFWEERLLNTFWDIWFNLLGYRLGEMALLYVQARRRDQQVVMRKQTSALNEAAKTAAVAASEHAAATSTATATSTAAASTTHGGVRRTSAKH